MREGLRANIKMSDVIRIEWERQNLHARDSAVFDMRGPFEGFDRR